MEPNREEAASESVGQGSLRPVATFSGSGGIRVAIWKNKMDNGVDHYSVKLERNYKDAEGEFHSTPYIGENDLLRAQKLLSDADSWIEQDRAKQRATLPRER